MAAAALLKRPLASLARSRWVNQGFAAFLHHDGALAEYTDVPKYPEILDESPGERKRRVKEAWHARVTRLPTVEQKVVELNMPHYYGYKSCHIKDIKPMLLGTDFCQFATRTHVATGLPQEYYKDVWGAAEAMAGRVASQVEQLIDFNYNIELNRRVKGTSATHTRRKTQNFLLGLHRVLVAALQDTPHIRDAMVDLLPRVETFWILGSLPPDSILKKKRRGMASTRERENEPIDRSIQATSSPFLGVRVGAGLPAVVGREDALSTSAHVPGNTLDPRVFGFKFGYKYATTVPGFLPGVKKEHSHLYLHTRDFEEPFVAQYGAHNLSEAFVHKAVIASFTQAHALATYLGFGPVTEMTYPLVQQSAFTDGRRWNLSLYQLNTCALHSERPIKNPHNNILWLSEEQELFEAVDGDGVKGLNTSLLTSLLAMYLKEGTPKPDPCPYLPLKNVANHPAIEEYRDDFHKTYLMLLSNRPRHRPKPEIYLWEKIYKIDHKTRPFEPPRRFFEDHFNKWSPMKRRLDDCATAYIPRDRSKRQKRRVRFKPKLDTELLYRYD